MVELIKGIAVSAGRVMGPVHFREEDLEAERDREHIMAELADEEVSRFERALDSAHQELQQIKAKHREGLGREDARIFDVHQSYLRDPVFTDSVEKMIRQDLYRAESAVAKVVSDFERVMELVENKGLRERAEDLRDVGLRVLRWMRAEKIDPGEERAAVEPEKPYILAASRLSISDMFTIDREKVVGILAEEGGVDGHAAILARSLGIPAMTGVKDLFDELFEGDMVILDAEESQVRIRPTEREMREFEETADAAVAAEDREGGRRAVTRDGVEAVLMGSCGTMGDVSRCLDLGLEGIGVFRTEKLFVISGRPSLETLVEHYREVLRRAGGAPVTFRLLDTGTRNLEMSGIEERNPSLGLRSLRLLLKNPGLLRHQLRAFLRAAAGDELHLLVPFATGREDLVELKEALREVVFEERRELERTDAPGVPEVHIGLCLEVPALALVLRDVIGEVDFLVVALDDLAQHLYAADRDSTAVRRWYRAFHPALFRLLAEIVETARQAGKPVGLFGEGAADVLRLPFYWGAGYRSFSISPYRVPAFRSALSTLTTDRCREVADQVLALSSGKEIKALLQEESRG